MLYQKKVISVTSARGRGKSSAMGPAVAGAVCYGYSNIIVTAPRIGMFAVYWTQRVHEWF